MSHKIPTSTNPNDCGRLCEAKEVEINPGLTILAGCNGAGKSTMLHDIAKYTSKNHIPTLSYNHRTQGEHHATDRAKNMEDFAIAISGLFCSEGENININLAGMIPKIRNFIKTGDNGEHANRMSSKHTPDDELLVKNERWLLFDAIDSGSSIDNIRSMRKLFDTVLKTRPNDINVYIVVSANSYEMVKNADCIDVMNGKHVGFESYDDFANFIMASAERKRKRDDIAKEKER